MSFRQAQAAGYAAALVLYGVALAPGRTRPGDTRIDYALLFICLPLFNPNSWMLNFVALAVPYILLIGYLIEVKGKDMFVAACVIGAVLATVVMAQDIVGNDLENLGEAFSNVTFGTLLLFAALVKLKFILKDESAPLY